MVTFFNNIGNGVSIISPKEAGVNFWRFSAELKKSNTLLGG
jgi:hypothetical protein